MEKEITIKDLYNKIKNKTNIQIARELDKIKDNPNFSTIREMMEEDRNLSDIIKYIRKNVDILEIDNIDGMSLGQRASIYDTIVDDFIKRDNNLIKLLNEMKYIDNISDLKNIKLTKKSKNIIDSSKSFNEALLKLINKIRTELNNMNISLLNDFNETLDKKAELDRDILDKKDLSNFELKFVKEELILIGKDLEFFTKRVDFLIKNQSLLKIVDLLLKEKSNQINEDIIKNLKKLVVKAQKVNNKNNSNNKKSKGYKR